MPPSRGLIMLLLTCITTVLADLPIHCLNAQLAGQWELRLSKPQSVLPTLDNAGVTAGSGYDKDVSCGYDSPDKSSLHFATNSFELQVDRIFKITLKTPNIVTDSEGNNGTYTMVYDEAYEVFLNGYSYFAFMRYRPKPSTESLNGIEVGDYISECGHTLIGWYRSIDNKYWGCWQGRQTYRSVPEAWPNHGRKGKCKKYEKKPNDLALLQVDGLLKETSEEASTLDTDQLSLGRGRGREFHTSHRSSKVVRPKNTHVPTPYLKRRSTHDSLQDADGCDDIDTIFDHQEAVVSTTEFSGDTMFFQPDPVFVETHNAQKDKLWTATIHKQFVGMRMSELMAMHGMQRFNKHVHHGDDKVGPFAPKQPHPPPIKDDRPDEEKYSGLPETFSWLNHDGINWDVPVRNQGSCGSCYAMASTTAFEARIRVASNNKYKPRLSTQAVLSCSFYNQACDGGYPYLVGKHGAEFGFVDEECYSYTAHDGKCSQQCPTGKRWFFKNYRYIGGYYGACSEVAMMHEIMNGGPIMIAFEAPHTLTYYHGGIFTGPDPKTEPSYANGINPWQHTNHAVVGVGWGIDGVTGTKYWIIKNTWGEHWGENGFFRIRRGTNECGIESMATTADPILP